MKAGTVATWKIAASCLTPIIFLGAGTADVEQTLTGKATVGTRQAARSDIESPR